MRKLWLTIIVTLLLSVSLYQIAAAQDDDTTSGRDAAFEQAILNRLEAINPAAGSLFQQATAASDAGDMDSAKALFEQVLQLAPDFPDALRRLSYVESSLGNTETAVELAQRAYEIDVSPYNQAALAAALLQTNDAVSEATALQLARQATQALPDDAYAHSVLLFAGLMNVNIPVIRQASEALVRITPEEPVGHYYLGLALAENGEWERSEAELLLAQDLGWPAVEVERALDIDIAREASTQRLLRTGITIIAIWAVGLVMLFILGLMLSYLTLSAVQRTQVSATFTVDGRERLIRNSYRAVIALTSAYYYLSIPILILFIIGVVGGVFYLSLGIGQIPMRLAAFVVIAALITLYAIVRSLIIRPQQTEPGEPLAHEDAPALWQITTEVAQKVATRPIDSIYIVPGTTIGVMERGSILKKMQGEGQRYLILGLGALSGMTQNQFKAILAHEYGHFSNRDTAGGNLALQVQVSMFEMAHNLAVNGQAQWFNPVWIFLNIFNHIFLRTTLGASRLQEILADRYATVAYGARNFINGLTHIVHQSLVFETKANHELKDALENKRVIHNLYTLPTLESADQEKLKTTYQEIVNRPTSAYDSHPAIKDRIALVKQLASEDTQDESDPVWTLLPNAQDWQEKMTRTVYKNVLEQQGLTAKLRQMRQ